MDVYHEPNIFVRRMAYKPQWWKNSFTEATENNWNQGVRTWEEFNRKYITTTKKLKDAHTDTVDTVEPLQTREPPQTAEPLKTVKIHIINTATKQKPTIIHLQPKTEPIYEHHFADKKSSTQTMQDKCIFEDNAKQPLSPIKKINQKIGCSTPLTKRFLSGESLPPTPEGEIVQELVFDRFVTKTMTEEIKHSSPKSKDVTFNITDSEKLKNGTYTIKSDGKELPLTVKLRQLPQLQTVFSQRQNVDFMKLTPSLSDSTSTLSSIKSEFSSKSTTPEPVTADMSTFSQGKFLDAALGDELQTTVEGLNDTIVGQKDTSLKSNMISIGTADASELISQRDTCRTVDDKSEFSNSESNFTATCAHENKVRELMQMAAEQHYHMQQASKAITLCRMTKEFAVSTERLEAERLLLLAVLKNGSTLDEINRIDSDEYNESIQQGNLTVSKIRVPLTSIMTEAVQYKFEHFTQWFLCIGMFGSQVYASQVVAANERRELRFNEEMEFTKLPPDFSLDLFIYVFEEQKNVKNFSHTSKYHLNGNYQCPTPKKLFKKHVSKQVVNRIPASVDYIRSPSFQLAGSIKINLKNLQVNGKRQLHNPSSYLDGTIAMNINTNLQIYVKCYGFLTMRSEAGGYPSWSRHWCLLEGHYLKYWNYPGDADIKDPIGVIDLKKCVTSWVDIVNTDVCTKPRTLLLETIRKKKPSDENSLILECRDNYAIIKHFLACDSDEELKKWSKQLNLIVSFLRNWNIIENVNYENHSDV